MTGADRPVTSARDAVERLLPADAAYDAEGHLSVGGCDLAALAEAVGTPAYVYAEEDLRERARRFVIAAAAADPRASVHFALKALPCRAILRLVAEEGLGWEASSSGELRFALEAGADPELGILTGVDLEATTLRAAVGAGLGLVVLDSEQAIRAADAAALELGRTQPVLLSVVPRAPVEGIRHDPETGQLDRKGGLPIAGGHAARAAAAAREAAGLRLLGAHIHLGARLYDEVGTGIDQAVALFAELGLPLELFDVGGGPNAPVSLASPPTADIEAHASLRAGQVHAAATRHGLQMPRVAFEPGRAIAGPAGLTLYRVRAVRRGVRTYVVVDGGLHENPRPLVYGTAQEALPVVRTGAPSELVSVAGLTAEAGDVLAWDVEMPLPQPGDLLAIPSTGAYVHSMAGNWNLLPRPPVVFCEGGRHRVVIRRETHADVTGRDIG